MRSQMLLIFPRRKVTSAAERDARSEQDMNDGGIHPTRILIVDDDAGNA